MSSKGSTLYLRIISALILMPLVLFALIYGGWAFVAMSAVALIISLIEWVRMAKLSPRPFLNGVAGVAYILFCIAAFSYLRLYYPDGAGLALALILGIWASDTGAYFAGKTIGGPKMAPAISPNKTWAGLIGGVISSALLFVVYSLYIGPWLSGATGTDMAIAEHLSVVTIIALGASVTISGQLGDLLISMEKRKVGVKDTGNLIPGHGGLLDRIDSLLLAAPVFLASLKVLGL